MVNASSLPGGATAAFDLESHAGVMQLLASIRASEVSAAEKNELRDLVFLYTNGGKDQTVRRALEQKISQHAIAPVAVKAPRRPLPPPPTIGKYRAAPSFHVPAITSTKVEEPKPVFTTAPAWKHEEPHKADPAVKVEVMPEAVAELVAPPAPAPTTTIPVQSAAPVVAAGDTDAYLLRIREIKSLVNEKVGNPVNLVDINNQVGREYMAALLDAMKKINSGTSASSAMKRLEEAYVLVEQTLEGQPAISAPVPGVSAMSHGSLEFVEAEQRESLSEPIAPPIYDAPSQFETPTPFDAPVEAYVPPPVSRPPTIAHVSPNVTPVVAPLGAPAPVPVAAEQQYFTSLAGYGERPATAAAASQTPLKTSAIAGDPLFTAEVDEGLQQLLTEWSLFKKSGLFGTGPKGKEHPLFKKMAPLQIPLLLAGRFEGATQEIKQSVTDYMNGWRYEQGLIYQQGETFEHYLRRVIRHIIDLQKGKS